MIRLFLAAAALAPLPACAQAPVPAPRVHDADPALWVVRDRDTTIYLFGTIHVLRPGLTWFDEAVKAAFDRSDTLVTEIVAPDPAAMQALVARVGAADAGAKPLSAQLPADKRDAYAQALTTLHLPATGLDGVKPWLAAVTLSVAPLREMGFSDDNGPETVLAAAAKAAGKRADALETAEEQFGYFNSLSPAAQLTFLTATVDELPKLRTTMDTMVAEWSAGDPDALAREMNDSLKDSPEVATTLLYARNKRWAGWIAERMKRPGTVFIAVGAGHLAGKGSVQDQLGAYRLKAVRVRY